MGWLARWFRKPTRSAPASFESPVDESVPAAETAPLFDKLRALRASLSPIPMKHALDRLPLFDWLEAFDANRFLEVFDQVRMKEGYALDYVYEWTGIGGHPLLYARKVSEKRIATVEEYRRKYDQWARPYLDQLAFELSPLGCFEFALFDVVAHQFYLSWHDNYNDTEWVCSAERLEEILKPIATEAHNPMETMRVISEEDRQRLRALDLNPHVRIAGKAAEVSVLAFTKWGGFALHHTRVTWPHHLGEMKREEIARYQCGIVF